MTMTDLLASWALSDFTDGPWTRPVYRKGSGPAVIIMHEIPGLHPLVVEYGERVVAAGMTVFMPSLFGTPGKPMSTGYALGQMVMNVCIRREFNAWANDRSSPIVDWLRALARKAHADCGGKGVGALGMCFTGGFALAMMTEPSVVAPVLSQPSLPFGKKGAAKIDASPREIACARQRMIDEDLSMIGLAFDGDPFVPEARMDMLQTTFGERFERPKLTQADARPGTGMAGHSVLTVHLNNAGPTKEAEARTIAFFRHRLGLDPA